MVSLYCSSSQSSCWSYPPKNFDFLWSVFKIFMVTIIIIVLLVTFFVRTSILLFTLTRSPFLQIHCSWRGNIRIEMVKCDSYGVVIAKNAVLAPSNYYESTQTLWIQPRHCESNPWGRAELASFSFFWEFFKCPVGHQILKSFQKHPFIVLPLTYSLLFSIYCASRFSILKITSTIHF